jgi:hypothetical protein
MIVDGSNDYDRAHPDDPRDDAERLEGLALSIARKCAKEAPESYYAAPFQPHQWVLNAITEALLLKPFSDGHTTTAEAVQTANEMHTLAEMRAEECDDTAATLLSKGAAIIQMLVAHRPLPSPEKIDQLALELAMMGVKVPPRDTAFFQAAVSKWLCS